MANKGQAGRRRGKLRIYFGMAAGVGKTYAMLEAARKRQAQGADVVVGDVETHGQAETEALLAGLPVVPRKRVDHAGAQHEELDLDAILARQPQLVLVDELAHANTPGLRHPKRYQDVYELLDAGIDVCTTMNVQHLASRADTVWQITGTAVRETVPDSVMEQASEIVLIDLPPEELLERLANGKVHTGQNVESTAQAFFRLGNLNALREMALRVTAERVNDQLRDYMQVHQIAGPWKSGERLLVAVSDDPESEQLVRWTRRMANSLEAPWLAVYVETSRMPSQSGQTRLSNTLTLARELGAEVVMTTDEDVPRALLRIARERNVTQIVVGKPARGLWRPLAGGAQVVKRLIRESGNIDISVIKADAGESASTPPAVGWDRSAAWLQYPMALAVVAITTIFNLVVLPGVGYHAVALVYLLVISILGLFAGRGPVLAAAAVSAVLWNYAFIPPRFTMTISSVEDILMFGMYFIIALITGSLTSRLRAQEKAGRQREERATAMYALAREVSSAVTMSDVLRTAAKQIGQAFSADVAFLLTWPSGQLADLPHATSTLALTSEDMSVARLAFEKGTATGRFTDTLPMADAQFLPLRAPSGIVGVMGVRTREDQRLAIEQHILLETFAGQIALTIERERLDEAAEGARVVVESERLYKTLLNSVSHELRTPIAAIASAASSLLDSKIGDNLGARTSLAREIQDASGRLDRVVENLLSMTRLESGRLKPNMVWCDVSDLIGVAVRRIKDDFARHDLSVDVAPDLPLVRMDFVLMEQALMNLLHNAAVHTPPGTRIRVTANVDGNDLLLSVADRGPGLPPGDLHRVFEKFYRAPGAAPGGTGLGLSITKGLVEAQGGVITAENSAAGGANFVIRLPVRTPPVVPQEKVE